MFNNKPYLLTLIMGIPHLVVYIFYIGQAIGPPNLFFTTSPAGTNKNNNPQRAGLQNSSVHLSIFLDHIIMNGQSKHSQSILTLLTSFNLCCGTGMVTNLNRDLSVPWLRSCVCFHVAVPVLIHSSLEDVEFPLRGTLKRERENLYLDLNLTK